MNPLGSLQNLSGDLLVAAICGLIFIEEIGIPVPFAPGDLLLLIAGIAIASDNVDPLPMLAGVAGATILGALLGRETFALVGRPALLKAAGALGFRHAVERATETLRRGGARAVFVGRLTPGLRITTTQVAGVSKIPRLTFLAGLVPSVAVYMAVFIGLGVFAGDQVVGVLHQAQRRLFVVVVSLLLAVAVVLSIRWLARRGALNTLEPIVLGLRRDLADEVEARLPWHGGAGARWRQYPLLRRFWAGFLDLALIFGLTVFALTALAGFDNTEVVLDPEGLLLLVLVALLYRIPMEAATGQTLGKRMMGISVHGPDGSPPGLWRAGLRNILAIVPPLWLADAVLLMAGRRRQRVGEFASATTVRRVAD